MSRMDGRTRRWLLRSCAVGTVAIAGCTGGGDGDGDGDGGGNEDDGGDDDGMGDGNEGDEESQDGEGDEDEEEEEEEVDGDDEGEDERPVSELVFTVSELPEDGWEASVVTDTEEEYSLVFSRGADGNDYTMTAAAVRHGSTEDAAGAVETDRSAAEGEADVQSVDVGDDGFAFLDEEPVFFTDEGAYVTFHAGEVVGRIEYYVAEDGESIVPSLEDAIEYADLLEATITGTD